MGVDCQAEAQRLRQQQKEEKHSKSKSIVRNWENTIDGQRLKRLQAMKLKNEQEEVALLSAFYCPLVVHHIPSQCLGREAGGRQEGDGVSGCSAKGGH